MNDVEVFEIDDDFDPLEDIENETEDQEPDADYLPPIPDAELSKVPAPVVLSPEELIERLITGIPGQRFRLLHAVDFCAEPHTFNDIVADLNEAFPDDVSVYDAAQIVQLLEDAQALESMRPESEEYEESDRTEGPLTSAEGTPRGEKAVVSDTTSATQPDDESAYLVVKQASPRIYTATPAGLAAVEASCGDHVVIAMLTEDEQYLPLYRTILEMTSQPDGCPTKELDAIIDPDPLCANPRKFCGYFLGRLEKTGALTWRSSWIATDIGKRILASEIFNH